MKVTPEMKVKDALAINNTMLDAFTWLAPEFERLRNPKLRRLMADRITISQAARVARIPLTEALYVLNLTAGETESLLSEELAHFAREDFEAPDESAMQKPAELLGVLDDDLNVHFIDVMEQARLEEDPMPKILKGLKLLASSHDILLVRHPFDPVPLRDLLALKHGLTSWAEEREQHDWYIYFYRSGERAAAAVAHPSSYKSGNSVLRADPNG